jgi:cobalt-zinc-cadmium efflux system outer membrane protein
MWLVTQPLPIAGRRQLDADAASNRVSAITLRADDRVRRVRANVRVAFTALWAAQVRERELQSQHDQLQRLADTLARREEAGEASGFDRLRAERDVLDIDTTRAGAAIDRARAQAILAGWLGAGAIDAVRSSAPAATLPTEEELMGLAEKTRGDLLAWQREFEAAQLSERAAGRMNWPEPEIVAGTKSSNVGGGDTGGVFGAHFTLPLFDRAAPEKAVALARASQAKAEAELARRTIRAEINAWRSAVLERRAIANRYRDTTAGIASPIERIALVSYEAGERGILELLDAFRTAGAARLRQVELDSAVREAEIELAFVSGWDLP